MVTPFFGRTLYNALDTAVEVQTKRTKWADLGDRGEAYVAAYLEQDGFEILGRQIWVRTSAGIRITDFIVTGGAFGTQLVGVEVKVNTSVRTPGQIAKDELIQTSGGTIANWSRANFTHGETVQYPTLIYQVIQTGGGR